MRREEERTHVCRVGNLFGPRLVSLLCPPLAQLLLDPPDPHGPDPLGLVRSLVRRVPERQTVGIVARADRVPLERLDAEAHARGLALRRGCV